MHAARVAAAVVVLLAAAVAAAARRLDVVQVTGRSMWPTLRPGDRLLIARLRRAPRPGEIVLAADPRDARRELVKRVAHVDGTSVTLRGDDPSHSTDARTFGTVPVSAVRWRVLVRYWPLGRRE